MPLFGSMTNGSSDSFSFDGDYASSRVGPSNHHDSHGLPDFNYDKIQSQGQTIRLLKLIAGIPSNPTIDCELVETRLGSSKPIKYEALSWCWGTSKEEGYIRIRGKRGKAYAKKAKRDLVKALLALRSERWDRYLWIDAVCINQEDMDEKNQQVQMMAEIYGNAKRVCVWLGQPDESSRLAIRFIRDEILKLQDFDDLCDSESNSSKWKALLDLMQRPWFSRRWVVQEISLAQKALLYCGQDRISWNKFSIAVELFVEVETATHRLSEVMKRDRKFHHVPGWFDYVSQLGASLLVDATGKLFRDHKEFGEKKPTRKKGLRDGSFKHAIDDSDSEGISDDSGEEEEIDPQEDGAFVLNGHGSGLANVARANRKAHHPPHTPSRENELLPTVKGQPLLGLEALVSSLAIFDVTNAHDTIYALLAISKDTTPIATNSPSWHDHTRAALEQTAGQRRYEVDYKKPYVDACQYFIRFCIHRALKVDASRALDLILRPWAVEEAKVCERFKTVLREQEKKQKDKHPDDLMRREDYLPLPSWVPQLSKAPFAMQMVAGVPGPKVGRTNADPLVGVPNQNVRNYKAAETKGLDTTTLKFRKQKGQGPDNYYSMFVKGFVLDTIAEVKDASQSGNIPSDWADFAGWAKAQGDPPDAFWRTLVGDRGRDGKNPPVYYARACKESFEKGGYLSGSISTSNLIRDVRVSIIAQFCWRVQSVIWKKALAKTASGKLALVAPGVKKGDIVCILYGCSVPVILRMSKPKSDEQLTTEATLELEVLRHRITTCAITWLARTQHYRKKRNLEMEEYRVWEETKKLQFSKDEKWHTDWLARWKLGLDARSGSSKEIAKPDPFRPQPAAMKAGTHEDTENLTDDSEQNASRISTFGTEQQNRPSTASAPQHLGQHGRGKSGWEVYIEKIMYLQACKFDDWKKEKRKEARELRDKAIESSWGEPRVNWREFKLGLKYGRKWKKFLQKRREEEEEEMMLRRDELRERMGFKLKERPAKRQPRLLVTEEVHDLEGNKTITKLTKESAMEVEKIWLDNVRKAMRNEKRDGPSENGEDSHDGGKETERPRPVFAEATTSGSDLFSEPPDTEANVEKSRQSYLYSYKLLGDCYLHGMMDGEAIAAQNGHGSAKTIPAVVFEIR